MLRSNWMLIKNSYQMNNTNKINKNRLITLLKLMQMRRKIQLINKIQRTIQVNKQKKNNLSLDKSDNNNNELNYFKGKNYQIDASFLLSKIQPIVEMKTLHHNMINKGLIKDVAVDNEDDKTNIKPLDNKSDVLENNIDVIPEVKEQEVKETEIKEQEVIKQVEKTQEKDSSINKNSESKLGFFSKLAINLKKQNKNIYPFKR